MDEQLIRVIEINRRRDIFFIFFVLLKVGKRGVNGVVGEGKNRRKKLRAGVRGLG